MPTYQDLGYGQQRAAPLTGDRARSIFGQVMGLVAFTMAFAALGAFIARDMTGGTGFIFFIGAFACIFGLNAAVRRGREQLATGLLFGMGLLLGMFIAPVLNFYANTNPGIVYQAAGLTALFTATMGGIGYTTRRDLSGLARALMIPFIVVLLFGMVTIFVTIPGANVIYCVLMLVIFAGFTAFDFQRLSRAGSHQSPVPIAASIFLDIFNVFLLILSLLGGGGRR